MLICLHLPLNNKKSGGFFVHLLFTISVCPIQILFFFLNCTEQCLGLFVLCRSLPQTSFHCEHHLLLLKANHQNAKNNDMLFSKLKINFKAVFQTKIKIKSIN